MFWNSIEFPSEYLAKIYLIETSGASHLSAKRLCFAWLAQFAVFAYACVSPMDLNNFLLLQETTANIP